MLNCTLSYMQKLVPLSDFLAHSYAEVHFIINMLKSKQNALPPSLKWCIGIVCSFMDLLSFFLLSHVMFSYLYYRLSFALAASEIKEKTRVVAMDLRGHGKSSTDNDLDLSVEVETSENHKYFCEDMLPLVLYAFLSFLT